MHVFGCLHVFIDFVCMYVNSFMCVCMCVCVCLVSQTERENSNSKTLFYKDYSLGSVKNLTTSLC